MNQLKILAVDDEKNFTSMLSNLLRHKNYNLTTVHSGSEALSIFEKNKFDLILLDSNMPVMDGFEVLEKIRNKDNNIPVIFLSGNMCLTEDLVIKKGGNGLVRKPFNFNVLIEKIEKITGTQ